ncbi:hypothetical protein ACLKA6_001563 [Drosophila palustris]
MSHWSSSLELSLILEQKQHGGLELVANSTLQCRLCHWTVSSVRPGAPRKVCTARMDVLWFGVFANLVLKIIGEVETTFKSRVTNFVATDKFSILPEITQYNPNTTAASFKPLLPKKLSATNRWKRIVAVHHAFWRRWSLEYLTLLQERSKWTSTCSNIQQGTLVLIGEDNTPPGQWALGRVHEVHTGADGAVRVVTIKTKTGFFKRNVHKICPLPMADRNQENLEEASKAGNLPPAAQDLPPAAQVMSPGHHLPPLDHVPPSEVSVYSSDLEYDLNEAGDLIKIK